MMETKSTNQSYHNDVDNKQPSKESCKMNNNKNKCCTNNDRENDNTTTPISSVPTIQLNKKSNNDNIRNVVARNDLLQAYHLLPKMNNDNSNGKHNNDDESSSTSITRTLTPLLKATSLATLTKYYCVAIVDDDNQISIISANLYYGNDRNNDEQIILPVYIQNLISNTVLNYSNNNNDNNNPSNSFLSSSSSSSSSFHVAAAVPLLVSANNTDIVPNHNNNNNNNNNNIQDQCCCIGSLVVWDEIISRNVHGSSTFTSSIDNDFMVVMAESIIKCLEQRKIIIDLQVQHTATVLNMETHYAVTQKQLLAKITHDLRTPLTAVQLSLSILQQEDEQYRLSQLEHLKTAIDCTNNLGDICKQIHSNVNSNTSTVDDERQKSTTITDTTLPIPTIPSLGQQPFETTFNEEKKLQQQRRALVIDDSIVIRKSLTRALERLGYDEINSAPDGQVGLEYMMSEKNNKQPFDIVLCDFLMPVLDGMDCVRQYRSYEKQYLGIHYKQLYIVGMSAHASTNDIERGISIGMDTFIEKPILFQQLKELLDRTKQERIERRLRIINDNNNNSFVTPIQTDIILPISSLLPTNPDKTFQTNNLGIRKNMCLLISSNNKLKEYVKQAATSNGWLYCIIEKYDDGLNCLKARNWEAVIFDDDTTIGESCLRTFRTWEKTNRIHRQKGVYYVVNNNSNSFDYVYDCSYNNNNCTNTTDNNNCNKNNSNKIISSIIDLDVNGILQADTLLYDIQYLTKLFGTLSVSNGVFAPCDILTS